MATGTLRTELLPPAGEQDEPGIDLLAIVLALVQEWRLGLRTFLLAAAVGLAVVYSLKPKFVATAVILPQEGRATVANPLASLLTTRGPGGVYIGLLRSRSVQDEVIDKVGLLKQFGTTSRETARDILGGMSGFSEDANSLLTISVRDKNAETAAVIANAYLDALQGLNNKMNLAQSVQTREFFKGQLEEERDQLAAAEVQLESTQRRTGVVQPETQTQIGLSAIAATRAQITQLQVQLAALLRGATEQNPEVQRLKSQLAQLQVEERSLEQGSTRSPAGAAPPAAQLPHTNLDLLRAQREVTYHNALVTSLANQFEAARLTEASTRSAFQVVDRAIAPERKAWPPRSPFIAAALVFAVVLALVAIVVKLVWGRLMADPVHRERLGLLRQAASAR